MSEETSPAAVGPLDVRRVMAALPHRYPMLLVDRVEQILPGQSITAIKAVSMNEGFFQGHFPGNPVFPGVLQIEAMAQIGGILVLNTVPDPENYWTYFLGIESISDPPLPTVVMVCSKYSLGTCW